MLSLKLDMNELIAKVRSYFSDTILKRGWSYYRGGFVRALQVEKNEIITAKVLGSDLYRVRLNLASFSASSCDCPYGYYCKHMAAVVFAVCEEAGNNPKDFLSPGAESKASQGKAVIASVNTKTSLLSKPKESETPASWHHYFDSQAFPISHRDLYQLESIMVKVEHQLAAIADSWALVQRAFYLLHVQLFLMKLADSKFLSFQEDFYNYHNPKATFSRISKHCIEQILRQIHELHDLQAKEQYPLHLAETADYLAEHAFPDPEDSCMGWMDVYRLLWWDLLEGKDARRQEVERLHALLDAGGMTRERKDSVSMAVAHFDIVSDRDQAAMEWMERQVQDVEPGMLFGYVQKFQDLEQGSRLLNWLRWLKPYVLRSGRAYIQVYLGFWANAVKIQDSQEEWRELAVGLLPESYWAYSSSLLERKYYQEWVDLILLMEFTPLELEKSELKIIETQDLRLLLPLYHNAVERYIQEKNRDSYKRAVRMLKKLHAMYKKLKEPARWEQYIGHVSKQYVRYRAFQEELRKGKLIV
jgi:hypothetical protein